MTTTLTKEAITLILTAQRLGFFLPKEIVRMIESIVQRFNQTVRINDLLYWWGPYYGPDPYRDFEWGRTVAFQRLEGTMEGWVPNDRYYGPGY